MRTSKGKFKQRKRTLSKNECFIYQVIESCLKLDLDKSTALNVINLILKHYSHLMTTDKKIITIEKMDYRNFRRYVNELMAMSPLHKEYFKQYDTSDPNGTDRIISKEKTRDIRQLENLLFNLTDNNNKKNLPYKKYKIADTDDLVFRALIQLDKSYTF